MEHTGLLEERIEKQSKNGAKYFQVKIGGKIMNAFGDVAAALQDINLSTELFCEVDSVMKNGRSYHNLQAFSIKRKEDAFSGTQENLRVTALLAAVEYSKTQVFYDSLEKDQAALDVTLKLAETFLLWLQQ